MTTIDRLRKLCEEAYLATYTKAAEQEANDERHGWTEQCYSAEQLREAFEDGWNARDALERAEG